jgi:hypothetical protein
VCAVLSAAAKWIHSVISVTPTGLTHFIGGAPLAALSDAVYWAATGQWGTAVISDEAAGASLAAYSYTLASITTGTGACSLYSEPLRMGISYGAGVFFRLTPVCAAGIYIGSRIDDSATRHFMGTTAGVAVSHTVRAARGV